MCSEIFYMIDICLYYRMTCDTLINYEMMNDGDMLAKTSHKCKRTESSDVFPSKILFSWNKTFYTYLL